MIETLLDPICWGWSRRRSQSRSSFFSPTLQELQLPRQRERVDRSALLRRVRPSRTGKFQTMLWKHSMINLHQIDLKEHCLCLYYHTGLQNLKSIHVSSHPEPPMMELFSKDYPLTHSRGSEKWSPGYHAQWMHPSVTSVPSLTSNNKTMQYFPNTLENETSEMTRFFKQNLQST